MQIFSGNAEVGNTLHMPLQQLVQQQVLNDDLPTDENIRLAVEKIVEDSAEEINDACVCKRVEINTYES